MPHLAVISHKFDKFDRRSYLLGFILRELEQAGVTTDVLRGHRRFVPADFAILHVDSTIVDAEYVALAKRYPRTLNLHVTDIRKGRVSGAALAIPGSWPGPVIVKTQLNGRGMPELYHNHVAALRGKAPPHPDVTALHDYVIYDHVDDVPAAVWNDPRLAVEKFLPERDPRGYVIRTWMFMGASETCTRCVSPNPVVKGADIISRELTPVPEDLRKERARLGFDYGKFDFVFHEGASVLLDANMTPTVPENLSDDLRRSAKIFAQGMLDLL